MSKQEIPKWLPLKTIMTTEVITVRPETRVFEAMHLLPQHQISGLPVVDADFCVVGILTEKDVLEILFKEDVSFDETVAAYMTRDVVVFSEDDSALSACEYFRKNPIRRLPIVKNGKLIGIVSRRDILLLILRAKNEFSSFRFS